MKMSFKTSGFFLLFNILTRVLQPDATAACTPAPGGLVAWWQANGTAVDYIGGASGVLMPGTTFATGMVGQCFSFDGVGGCVMNDNTPPLTSILNTFTIEFWANPSKGFILMPEGGGMGISSESYAIFPEYGDESGLAGAGVSVGTNGISVVEHAPYYLPSLLSYTNPIIGWTHIAVVYTNRQPSLYVNGVKVRTGVTSTRTAVFPSRTLGSSYAGSGGSSYLDYGPYAGLLDEVSIYDHALGAGEISAIYAAGAAGKCFTPSPLVLTAQPASATNELGSTVIFSVVASSPLPVTYQWAFNGTNLLNATNATLTLTNVQFSQSGAYSVLVANINDSTNSASALLSVYALPPVITMQPASKTNYLGTATTFSVAVTGTAPLGYQWSLNGTNLTSATNATLALSNLQFSQAGDYAVQVTNPVRTTNSATVTLTVLAVPSCEPVPDGIAAWWQGEATAMDVVGGGNGTIKPGTTFAPGMVGQCFNFDGVNGCVMNTNTPSLTGISNSFTIEFWAYPTGDSVLMPEGGGLGNYGERYAIFPEYGDSGGRAGAGVSVGTNGILVVEHAPYYLPSVLSYTNPITGWTHVAVVYSNRQPTLYVNGVNVRTGITSERTSIFPSKNLGSSYGSSSGADYRSYGPYQGLLDEVSIYNRALAANEIAAIYGVSLGGKCFTAKPPLITAQPASRTNQIGTTAAFNVVAISSTALSYQWSFNGTNLNYATNATLTLTNVQPGQAGTYSVLLVNAIGSTNSAAATLAVFGLPPVITGQPSSRTNQWGTTATFSVTATGTAPLNYQWTFNGTNISQATNATLTLTNVQFNQAGSYAVSVSNAVRSTNSASVTLNVYALPPVITTQPASQTNFVGNTVVLYVSASGTAPLNYQWSLGGTNISNATNAALMLANVQLSQAGNYVVQVSNVAGVTNSTTITLTVNPMPACDSTPAGIVAWWAAEGTAWDTIGGTNGIVKPGTSFASGEVGLCFNFDGVNGCVMNTNSAPLTNIVNNFTVEFWANPTASSTLMPQGGGLGNSGERYALFPEYGDSNIGSAGAGVSVGTNGIMVVEHAPFYLPSVLSYTNPIHGWTHIAVVYSNKQPTLYVNGVKVRTGLTSTKTFVFPSKSLGSSYGTSGGAPYMSYGPYKGLLDEVSIYNRALASNEVVAIFSAGSGGKCLTPPQITGQPASQTNLVGTTATFSVTASGMSGMSYQWSFNGTNLSNGTNASLTLTNVQLAQAGTYVVLVTNSLGSASSIGATLTVALPPVITLQPQSQSVSSFNSVTFSVAASGTGTLGYQWRKNGTNLADNINVSGSMSTNLTLASVSLADVGSYDVVVTSPYAATNSTPALLAIAQTTITMGTTNTISGSTIVVPVLMSALGVENTFLASIGYDPTKLAVKYIQVGQATAVAYLQEVDTHTNEGYVGFAILLDSGSVIPAGTQEVAQVVFQTLPVTNNTSANLTFGDYPTGRQLVDNSLNTLPAVYSGGTVQLTPAEYAADVFPRTNGDHQISVQDWLEVGRMVAKLDAPTNSDEFLRADCAPRNAPDQTLTVADWVQAGRYALGFDPITLVTAPASGLAVTVKPRGGPAPSRILLIGNVSAQRGQTVSVPVKLVCSTNENAVGMTVGYSPSQLRLLGVSLGSVMTGGRVNINSNLLTGKIGVALALAPGAVLPPGTNDIAVLQFVASTNLSGPIELTLDDSVVKLQVADRLANSLSTAYINGSVLLPAQPTLGATGTGANMQLSWPLASGTFQIEAANNLQGPWTTVILPIITNGGNATVIVSQTNQQQYFRLQGQ